VPKRKNYGESPEKSGKEGGDKGSPSGPEMTLTKAELSVEREGRQRKRERSMSFK